MILILINYEKQLSEIMPPRNAARNPRPESIAANSESARLLTSLFTKGILKKDKARKMHQHPTYSAIFSIMAANVSQEIHAVVF